MDWKTVILPTQLAVPTKGVVRRAREAVASLENVPLLLTLKQLLQRGLTLWKMCWQESGKAMRCISSIGSVKGKFNAPRKPNRNKTDSRNFGDFDTAVWILTETVDNILHDIQQCSLLNPLWKPCRRTSYHISRYGLFWLSLFTSSTIIYNHKKQMPSIHDQLL